MEEPPLPPSTSTLSQALERIEVDRKSSTGKNALLKIRTKGGSQYKGRGS